VRPAVDGNRDDVARGIESPVAERPGELVADVSLKSLERCRKQVGSSDSMLLFSRLTW